MLKPRQINPYWEENPYFKPLGAIVYSLLIFLVLFEGLTDFHDFVYQDWLEFKAAAPPQFINFLNTIATAFAVFLQNYIYVWNLRFILLWFPNVNPYIQPFFVVVTLTQPYVDFIRANIPRPLGMDMSFLIAGAFLDLLVWYVPRIHF